MTECPDDNTLVAYVQGRLSTPIQASIERHVDRCARCGVAIAAAARIPDTQQASVMPAGAPGGLDVSLTIGELVGRYQVVGFLGAGAMGVVYAAHDPRLDRRVALKLLRAPLVHGDPNRSAGQRLLREAQALARVADPNVVSVFDAGEHHDQFFVTMELVEGITLTEWLAQPGRSWSEVVDAFAQAGRGLIAAHSAGVLHRDFKPDNVLVSNEGRVRVTDFGLARFVGTEDSPESRRVARGEGGQAVSLTATGTVLGTPAYMAPEQRRGEPATPATDQYSFCVALYEALHGCLPPPESSRAEARPAPTGSAPKTVPPWLTLALERGLEGDPGQRHPSMDALVRQLDEAVEGTGDVHLRANAILQLVMAVVHTAIVAFFIWASLTQQPETAGERAQHLAPSVGFAIALLVTVLAVVGWGPVGMVWTPINAYGLLRGRRWAMTSTLVYWVMSLPTCIATPLAIYGIWSLRRLRNKKRDPAASRAS